MAAILSITIAFIQMMLFKPFFGLIIFKWRKGLWFLLFIPMIITYIIINLRYFFCFFMSLTFIKVKHINS
jgi:hypothetical protein